jgi:hypothetical protein
MDNKRSFLTVTLEGQSVHSGRIPISHLLEFLAGLQKVLYRTGQVFLMEGRSTRKGQRPKSLKQLVDLDLVEVTHGSPSTLLRFQRRPDQSLVSKDEEAIRIFEIAFKGVGEVQVLGDVLPPGFDRGVLLAWRDIGRLFLKRVNSITFELNHRPQPLRVQYTPQGFQVIQQRIQGPQTKRITIEGRLLMADFKEEGMRLRVHPLVGEPVLCVFDEEQKEEVLENLLRRVRVVGEALADPDTGKISRVRIRDVEPLEDFAEAMEEIHGVSADVLGFWSSRTIEELAEQQGVKPVADIRLLYGTWPGDPNDDFENFVNELRTIKLTGESPS